MQIADDARRRLSLIAHEETDAVVAGELQITSGRSIMSQLEPLAADLYSFLPAGDPTVTGGVAMVLLG